MNQKHHDSTFIQYYIFTHKVTHYKKQIPTKPDVLFLSVHPCKCMSNIAISSMHLRTWFWS